jgi:hypothetical protein
MPDEIQYDANATPPQFTNNADMVIEPGTHIRVKIIGLRTEVGEMWAIGSINGDFLGCVTLQPVSMTLLDVLLTGLPLQMPAGVERRGRAEVEALVDNRRTSTRHGRIYRANQTIKTHGRFWHRALPIATVTYVTFWCFPLLHQP